MVPSSSAGTVEGYFIPGGMYGGYSGYYVWEDYCPNCDHVNCLLVNPKGTYEGEITCAICDSDYDGTTGADKHANGAWGYLIEYVEPEPEPEPVVVTAPVPELSPEEKMMNHVKTQINEPIYGLT